MKAIPRKVQSHARNGRSGAIRRDSNRNANRRSLGSDSRVLTNGVLVTLRGARTTLKGKPGQVGEIVRITGKQTLYAETLRIHDLHAIEGLFRAASIAFKVYDEPFHFASSAI